MPCRVGITRNPSKRKEQWKSMVVGLNNWQEDFIGLKSDAQSEENHRHNICKSINRSRGECYAHAGGGDPDSHGWYVYEFDYVRAR